MTLQLCTFEGDAVDTPGLRQALGRFATGVAVIATRTPEGKLEGLTANSFAAVSLDPPLVLWSLRRHAPSLPAFESSGSFSVNVLSAEQLRSIAAFRDAERGQVLRRGPRAGPGRLPADRGMHRLARVPHQFHGRWRRPSDLHRPRAARELRRGRAADLQCRAVLARGGVGVGRAATLPPVIPDAMPASRSGICRRRRLEVPDSLAPSLWAGARLPG